MLKLFFLQIFKNKKFLNFSEKLRGLEVKSSNSIQYSFKYSGFTQKIGRFVKDTT
jgi:hypothetical protein